MGRNLSDDEARAESIAAMPPGLGELHYELYTELAWAYLRWNDFTELFADKGAIDLLNATAPPFFADIQQTLWEAILLHLCRLTDPKISAGKATLTIQRLASTIPDIAIRTHVESLTTVA